MPERAVRVGEGALVDLIVERVVAMMELEGEEDESMGANIHLTASIAAFRPHCLTVSFIGTNLFILLRLIKGDRTFHLACGQAAVPLSPHLSV
jgi:hypothetical protein